MGFEQRGLGFQSRNAEISERRNGGVDNDSFSSRQLTYALARLKTALAAVDGLLTNASAPQLSECNAYQLGEASHVMHYALLMLGECAYPTEATTAGAAFR